MDVRITPEPPPEEREALLAALERLLAGRPESPAAALYRSGWRRQGVTENVEEPEEE